MRGSYTWGCISLCAVLSSVELFASENLEIVVRPRNENRAMELGFSSRKIRKIRFSNQAEKETYISQLQTDEWEPNQIYRATTTLLEDPPADVDQGDQYFATQWSLHETNSGAGAPNANIDAVRAWTIAVGASKVVIYVMDTGIDHNNADIEGRVTSSFNAFNPGGPTVDDNGHGTHVSSLAAARGGNGYFIRGVAWGEIEIGDFKFLNSEAKGDTQTTVMALNAIEEDMIERLSVDSSYRFVGLNSWAGSYSSMVTNAFQRLGAYDYLPITSAGNDSRNLDEKGLSPCTLTLLANTCVAASDPFDNLASFSSFGSQTVELLAPGVDIQGLWPGNTVKKLSGTSQAAPHVAGTAALIWSVRPDLSATQVREILMKSVDVLPGAQNYVMAAGRLNAYRALLMATNQDPSLADRDFSLKAQSGGCSLRSSSSLSPALIGVLLLGTLFFFFYRRRSISKT